MSRTATWTAERVADRLAEVQAVLGVSGASHLVQHWWAEFERLNRVRPKTFLRLAEELARRGATVSDYFAAYERGRVEDVQGALDFLDWTFLHAQAVNAADPVRRAALEAEARHHHLEYEKFTHAKDGWYRVVADAKAAPGTADAVYRAGVDRFPTSAPLRAAYAAYLNGAGRAVDAEAAAWAAVDLDPRYWPGYTALGDILTSTGRPRHAAAAHRRAIDLDEYAPAAHAGLGYALSQLTPYEAGEVVGAYRRAIELDPNRAVYFFSAAIGYVRLGLFQAAFEHVQEAVDIDPDWPTARYNLACVLARTGRAEAAVEALRVAVGEDPSLRQAARDDYDFDGIRTAAGFRFLVGDPDGSFAKLAAAPPEPGGPREFARLAAEWKGRAEFLSSPSAMARLPEYQAIVRMGRPVVPLILDELRREPHYWFDALRQITGTDPVPEAARGSLREMADAWLKWGATDGSAA